MSNDLKFKISMEAIEKLDIKQRKRNLVGSASCGLCGLESSESLYRILPSVGKVKMKIDTANAEKAISALHENQLLNSKTHSVHAAAWVNSSGEIIITREDVGRHNALDKLIGNALINDQLDPKTQFITCSGRLNFELVQKVLMTDIGIMIGVGAPTSLAIDLANKFDMTLVGFVKRESFNIYTNNKKVIVS